MTTTSSTSSSTATATTPSTPTTPSLSRLATSKSGLPPRAASAKKRGKAFRPCLFSLCPPFHKSTMNVLRYYHMHTNRSSAIKSNNTYPPFIIQIRIFIVVKDKRLCAYQQISEYKRSAMVERQSTICKAPINGRIIRRKYYKKYIDKLLTILITYQ